MWAKINRGNKNVKIGSCGQRGRRLFLNSRLTVMHLKNAIDPPNKAVNRLGARIQFIV